MSVEIISGRHIPASIVSYEPDSPALRRNKLSELKSPMNGLSWLSLRLGQSVTCIIIIVIHRELGIESRRRGLARCWSHYLDTVSMTLMADSLTVMKLPEISGLLRLWTVKL